MHRRAVLVARIVGLLIAITGITVLIRDSGVVLHRPAYTASIPATDKLLRIKRWIPDSATFYIAIDVYRVLQDVSLKAKSSAVTENLNGVAAELFTRLLEVPDAMGMVALVGRFGAGGGSSEFALIAEGRFDGESIVPAIRASLAAGRAGLVSEEVGGRKFFSEVDVKDPFGFVVLDGTHLAVGKLSSLVSLYGGWKPTGKRESETAGAIKGITDPIVFGHVSLGERIRALFPKRLPVPGGVYFEGGTDLGIRAHVPVADAAGARDLQMFLEGIRSLLLLKEETNATLVSMLKGVEIKISDGGVVIACDGRTLLGF